MVIVTQNQYILAKTIHHITLNENVEYIELRTNGKLTQVKCETFSINITYTPDVQSSNSRDDWKECMVVLRNKNRAYKAYKELIHQIREQNPDQLFLDKVMESILSSDIISNDKENDDIELEEKRHDGRTKKIRSIRKTKARSKKVLRKSKRSN